MQTYAYWRIKVNAKVDKNAIYFVLLPTIYLSLIHI